MAVVTSTSCSSRHRATTTRRSFASSIEAVASTTIGDRVLEPDEYGNGNGNGYPNRDDRGGNGRGNGGYGRGNDNGGYGRGNNGGYNGGAVSAIRWSGDVDDALEIRIQGNRIDYRTLSGKSVRNVART